ncbi:MULTISPECIES: hypothetical protein [unclassified Corynebacterium]|uniref:hypothetical protein n=1 Tax=unclassified Corynebacterium TaxID=2624378 RepID=UPI0035239C6D
MTSPSADGDSSLPSIPGDASALFSDGYDTVFSRQTPPGKLNRGLRRTLLRILGPAPFRAVRRLRNQTPEPVRPLSVDTLTGVLDALGIRHTVMPDRILIAWPTVRSELLLLSDNGGLHLVLRGRLRGRTGVEQLPLLQDALSLGDERSLLVCFYPAVAADATLSVRFHTSLCVEAGISRTQLRTFLERALVLVITGCLTLLDELPVLAGPRVDASELLRSDSVEATQPVEGIVIPPRVSKPVELSLPEPLDLYRLRLILEEVRGDAEPHPHYRALALRINDVDIHVTVNTTTAAGPGDVIIIARWTVRWDGPPTDAFGEAAMACAAFDRRCPTVNVRAALVGAPNTEPTSRDTERVIVCAVALFPASSGATDAQLKSALECGITGVVEAVTVIRKVLSDPI